MLTWFSFFFFCLFIFSSFICLYHIYFFEWEFRILNSQILNSVTDLNFGLYYPLVYVTFNYEGPILICFCNVDFESRQGFIHLVCSESAPKNWYFWTPDMHMYVYVSGDKKLVFRKIL